MLPGWSVQIRVALNNFLQTNLAELVKEMIEKYVPLDDDGTSTSRERVTKDFQVSVISNAFLPYYQSSLFCQSIIFIIFLFRSFTLLRANGFTHFSGKRPNVVSRDQLEKNYKEFGISDIKEWVERHGAMNGCFRFFETFAETSEIRGWPSLSSPCEPLDQSMSSAG